MPIEDPADPRLADYVDLIDVAARQRREGDQFFIAEGPVAIERLFQSDHRIRSVLVSSQKYERLAALLDGLTVPVYVAATRCAQGDGRLRHPSGRGRRPPIAGRCRRSTVLLPTARRIAVLEGLNDPENLGAIARSARAFGIDALVLDPTCIDPYYRRTVRVSMGEILFIPVARATRLEGRAGDDPIGRLRDVGIDAATDATDLWTLPVPDRLALVLGAEGPGLSRAAMAAASTEVRIPIVPDVDSLNVAAAAAVAFAAIAREPHAGSKRTLGS